MKTFTHITAAFLLTAGMAFTACERRDINNCSDQSSARIPVAVDWSESNITPTSRTGGDYVHRVSLRFFPKDGSPAFDRYLEGNVYEGTIEVPFGEYAVVAFNESVYDTYWSGAIQFTQTDDYNEFAANLVDDDPAKYNFYTPDPGEQLSVEPLKLASWSLDNFHVTANIANEPDYHALTEINMRQLVFTADVAAVTTNLNAAQQMYGILKGLARKVYMASGQAITSPISEVFLFDTTTWVDQTQKDGTIRAQFLTFGKQPDNSAPYWLALVAILKTGEIYVPQQPFLFDVSDQVYATPGRNVAVEVGITLPEAREGVDVGDWDDDEVPIH